MGETEYNLLSQNCQHFCTECRFNVSKSTEVKILFELFFCYNCIFLNFFDNLKKKVETVKKVGMVALGAAVIGGLAAFAAYKSCSNKNKEKEEKEKRITS